MRSLFFIVCLIVLWSCNTQEKITELRFRYIEEGVDTWASVPCAEMEFRLPELLNEYTEKDPEFLYDFNSAFRSLEIADTIREFDARIKCFIEYESGLVDTLCMGELFNIKVNRKMMVDNREFLNLVKSKIYDPAIFKIEDDLWDLVKEDSLKEQ